MFQGNNAKAIKALQAEAVKSDPDSFGVQISFGTTDAQDNSIMGILHHKKSTVDASIKAVCVELLQGLL